MMEVEHLDRYSMGGFDDSRDVRSQYSSDPLYLQNLGKDFYPIQINIKSIKTDNGLEFVNKECQQIFF